MLDIFKSPMDLMLSSRYAWAVWNRDMPHAGTWQQAKRSFVCGGPVTISLRFFFSCMKMATSVSAVTKRFAPDRKLINAKFEGYKLSPFPEQGSLFRTPLPCPGLAIEKAAQLNHLGFRDLQARVRFSHLAQGFPLNDNVGTAYYVDQEESKVVMVLFDKVYR